MPESSAASVEFWLRRARARIEKRWREPSYEGLPLCLFLAFEPAGAERDPGTLAMVDGALAEARLQALALTDWAIQGRYGADRGMIEWDGEADRCKEDVLAVLDDALSRLQAAGD